MSSFFQEISVLVNQTCNLRCKDCFIFEQESFFQGGMKLLNFSHIIDTVLLHFPLKSVTFTGGEPLLWEHLSEALKLVHGKNLNSHVVTNGMFEFKTYPHNIKINLRPWLEEKNFREKIENNIKIWKQNSIPTTALFSFGEEDSLEDIDTLFSFTEKIPMRLICYPRYKIKQNGLPYSLGMNKKIIDFFVHIRKKQKYQSYTISYPVTHCLDEYIEKNPNLFHFSCKDCPLFKPTFSSNAKNVSFCSIIENSIEIKSIHPISKLEDKLIELQKELALKNTPLENCISCKYYQKECQGGCLA